MSTEQIDIHLTYEQARERTRKCADRMEAIRQRLLELGVTELPTEAAIADE